jgi:hypothetical protein
MRVIPSTLKLSPDCHQPTNGLRKMTTQTNGQSINELSPGQFLKMGKVIPSGSLEVRKLASGSVHLYWRYSAGTVSERVAIGVYDPGAPPKSLEPTARGFSIQAAIGPPKCWQQHHHANLEAGGHRGLTEAKPKPSGWPKPPRTRRRSTHLQAC